MSIVLVGAPGAGKTTVGQQLALELGREFIDVDQRIEQIVGKSVPEIFADDGEAAFRALEESVTLAVIDQDAVVALGGGAVMSQNIRTALIGHDVIWLEVTISHAARRVGMNRVRPLLLGNVRGRLIELMRERAPLYEEVATTTINTNDKDPEAIAKELAEARR